MGGRAELLLRPGKERSLKRRHPWIYEAAIARVTGNPHSGATVSVRAADGSWLAHAAYAPRSMIRARCWSFREGDVIDAGWFGARISAALTSRSQLAADTDAIRLVFGEADQLPGLIADRYGHQLVLQFQAAGVDVWRETLIDALVAATGCRDVYDRSDAAMRTREGLAASGGVLRGAPPARLSIRELGVAYWVDVVHGHKTGFYIDQRDNRRLIQDLVVDFAARHQRAARVLNCFCYSGGFSIAAANAGAAQVVSVDSSGDALALARENWALNRLDPALATWRDADVFEELRRLRSAGDEFDLIVLDPPKFAGGQQHVERAARAYKDINLSALRLLRPGGSLLTFSCSGAVGVELFQKIVAGAVIDAGVDCQMLGRLAAGSDHPLLMTHPEGEYLKGLWLRRMSQPIDI
jgi:23S rRNA (cytosine1962-C5)-methyltransferase